MLRSMPLVTSTGAPAVAARTRSASASGDTPGSARTPIACTWPGRPASSAAWDGVKNKADCRDRAGRGRDADDPGTPTAPSGSSPAPGGPTPIPARWARSASSTTSPFAAGARPALSVNGARTAASQLCPSDQGRRSAPARQPVTTCAGKLSSATAARGRRGPRRAGRPAPRAPWPARRPARPTARRRRGGCTDWVPPTTTAASAYRCVGTPARRPDSMRIPHRAGRAWPHRIATNAPAKPPMRVRIVCQASVSTLTTPRGASCAPPRARAWGA